MPNDTGERIATADYDYELPKDLIAQSPLSNREDARLMLANRDHNMIDHYHVRDLGDVLQAGDCLVLNNTKVIPAKLVGKRKQTGGRWQGLFLQADENGNWKCLCKTRGKIKPGEVVVITDRHGVERAELSMVARLDDGAWVVKPNVDGTFEEVLSLIGRVPLPHYIRDGNMVDNDLKDYQTIYAKKVGAVAAPTAGLHLTRRLIKELIDAGIRIAQVTLHVGIGTFRPVTADHLNDHEMHFEYGEIQQKAVDILKQTRIEGGRIIAVGTTSVRVLETAAADGEIKPWAGDTNLFTKPPYEFKIVDGLMTNFHLPRSTLLVMIRTLGGDDLMKRAYAEAVEEKYRFFSYGDAMLIV